MTLDELKEKLDELKFASDLASTLPALAAMRESLVDCSVAEFMFSSGKNSVSFYPIIDIDKEMISEIIDLVEKKITAKLVELNVSV